MKAVLLLAALALPAPAFAQTPVPICVKAETVPGFEAFGGGGGAMLAIGRPATLALAPAAGQRFAPPLGRAPEAGATGGTFPLTIPTAGTYRIALSEGAWIDVIAAGARLPSAAHTHGPACSGIAKIVDFALQPGSYQLQLSAVKAAKIKAMVIAGK